MSEELARILSVSLNDLNLLLSLIGIILTVIIALIPSSRRVISRFFYNLLNVLGFTSRVYKKKFLDLHGILRNIYLDRIEELDLRSTYIPLHVNRGNLKGRVPALEILADTNERRILIVGNPGTGKTTLMKAFGTGILRPISGLKHREAQQIRKLREIPFIIDLRHFSLQKFSNYNLVQYLTRYVLKQQMKIQHGENFLKRMLRKKRCLLLLDGLDEVGEDEYTHTKTRIAEFCSDATDDFETNNARVVLTCRRQNFERIRSDWIPTLFSESFILAPFNTDEVYAFIERRKSDFLGGRTPIQFFEQIQSSGMVDLHRIPLVLTISLGLYLNIPKYQIPRSLATFYQEMIMELLRRHNFRTRSKPAVEAANNYDAEDKFRFLRELAFAMATRDNGFDEFSYMEIIDFFKNTQERIANVTEDDAKPFIQEIIYHAGLLSRISEDDVFIFAHRSIHEFFTALQLARNPLEGSETLLKKADNLRWRQIIVFFCSIDHELVESFLIRLMSQNLELAGHCVPTAQVISKSLADKISIALVEDIKAGNVSIALPALVSMTHHQDRRIHTASLNCLETVFTEIVNAEMHQFSGLNDEDIVELLNKLSVSGAVEVVPVCLQLRKLLDNQIDLIAPFWHCLTISGIEKQVVISRSIIRELLSAIITPDGLANLQRQPAFVPVFVTEDLRKTAYPFQNGQDLNSNFVTLLAWAEKLDIVPDKLNDFFQAKKNDYNAWKTVERDHSRFTLRIHWFYVGFLMNIIATITPLAYISYAFITNGWDLLLQHGESRSMLFLHVIISTGMSIAFSLSLAKRDFIVSGDKSPHIVDILNSKTTAKPMFILTIILLSIFFKAILADFDIFTQSALSVIFISLLYILPATKLFEKARYTYIQKPNPVIRIYDDERSKHWIQ